MSVQILHQSQALQVCLKKINNVITPRTLALQLTENNVLQKLKLKFGNAIAPPAPTENRHW